MNRAGRRDLSRKLSREVRGGRLTLAQAVQIWREKTGRERSAA